MLVLDPDTISGNGRNVLAHREREYMTSETTKQAKKMAYKSKLKSELAQAAGVSLPTFRRWLLSDQEELLQMGVSPSTKILPPVAVRYLCEKYLAIYMQQLALQEQMAAQLKDLRADLNRTAEKLEKAHPESESIKHAFRIAFVG